MQANFGLDSADGSFRFDAMPFILVYHAPMHATGSGFRIIGLLRRDSCSRRIHET